MQTKVNQNSLTNNNELCYVVIVVLSTGKIIADHILCIQERYYIMVRRGYQNPQTSMNQA